MKTALIFKGWASCDTLYDMLDLNEYRKIFIDCENITKLSDLDGKLENDEIIVVGWSLGAMLILQNIEKISAEKIVLISPTLNFLENQPVVVVKKMIKDLRRDKKMVLANFTKLNFYDEEKYAKYINEFSVDIENLNFESLEKGLFYLLEQKIEFVKKINSKNVLIITAEQDKIILPDNSKKVGKYFENVETINIEKCGHNIIYEKTDELNSVLRRFINDREEKS